MPSLPTPGASDDTWGQELNDFLLVAHNADGTINDASILEQTYTSQTVATYAAAVTAASGTQKKIITVTNDENSGGSGIKYWYDGSAGVVVPIVMQTVITTQVGTTYTIDSSDYGKRIHFTSASNITITLPTGLPAGFWCEIVKKGNGNITVVAGSSATLNSYGNTIVTQYGIAHLENEGSNVWTLFGKIV